MLLKENSGAVVIELMMNNNPGKQRIGYFKNSSRARVCSFNCFKSSSKTTKIIDDLLKKINADCVKTSKKKIIKHIHQSPSRAKLA